MTGNATSSDSDLRSNQSGARIVGASVDRRLSSATTSKSLVPHGLWGMAGAGCFGEAASLPPRGGRLGEWPPAELGCLSGRRRKRAAGLVPRAVP